MSTPRTFQVSALLFLLSGLVNPSLKVAASSQPRLQSDLNPGNVPVLVARILAFGVVSAPGAVNASLVSQGWRDTVENYAPRMWDGISLAPNAHLELNALVRNRIVTNHKDVIIVEQMIAALQRTHPQNARDWYFRHLFSEVLTNGHRGLFDLFIGQGVEVTALDHTGIPPFHHAVLRRNYYAATRLLETGAAAVDARDTKECSALHWAAYYGYVDVIGFLVSRGAQVNAAPRDHPYATPLYYAVINQNAESVRTLLENDSTTVNVPDQNGTSLLHMAAEYGNEPIAALLIRAGADVMARNRWGRTPLHVAAGGRMSAGHLRVAQNLIRAREDAVAARDGKGETPLHKAAEIGYADMVELLIASGAEIDAQNRLSCATPMFLVVQGRRSLTGGGWHNSQRNLQNDERWFDTAQHLLRAGANLQIPASVGNRPVPVSSLAYATETNQLFLLQRKR